MVRLKYAMNSNLDPLRLSLDRAIKASKSRTKKIQIALSGNSDGFVFIKCVDDILLVPTADLRGLRQQTLRFGNFSAKTSKRFISIWSTMQTMTYSMDEALSSIQVDELAPLLHLCTQMSADLKTDADLKINLERLVESLLESLLVESLSALSALYRQRTPRNL